MTDNFRRRVTRAALWSGGQNIAVQSLNFIKVVILARLVSPHDFGLFAVAILVLSLIDAFSTTGVEDALVQHPGEINRLIDAAWTIQFARGVIVTMLLVTLSGPLATLMGEPKAGGVLAIVGGVSLCRGTTNLDVISVIRDIRFHIAFIMAIVGVVTAFIVSLLMLKAVGGAYALAWGILAGEAATCLASYVLKPRCPRIVFSLEPIRTLMRYGVWISLNRMAFIVLLRLDSFIVSKFLGPQPLGFYQMGVRISDVGAKSIVTSLGSVAFASLSRLQDSPERMKRAYLEGLELVAYPSLFLAAFLSGAAHDIVVGLLGKKWVEAATILGLLVWGSGIRAVTSTAGWLFKALGKPSLDLKMSLLRGCVLVVAIWPLMRMYGITGVASAMLLSTLALAPMFWWYLNAMFSGAGWEAAKRLCVPLLISAMIYSVVALISHSGLPLYSRLVASVVASLSLALFSSAVVFFVTGGGPVAMTRSFLKMERQR